MAQSDSTNRVSVKTYVPEYQKQHWVNHASELGMSLSEFIRTMVQSGRQPFEIEQSAPIDVTPRVEDLKTPILDTLQNGPASWEEIAESVIGDIESDVEREVQKMVKSGEIVISPRTGQYSISDES